MLSPSSQEEKQKLCWNCDAFIHIDSDRCPYCGNDTTPPQKKYDLDQTTEQSFAPSPYQEASLTESSQDYQPPFTQEDAPESEVISSEEWDELMQPPPAEKFENSLFPSLCLSAGSVFLFFGLLLIFFSKNGSLTLTWNANYGIGYSFLALPLLILGWKNLDQS